MRMGRRLKWWVLSAVVALGIAAAVPFLVPASSFIPEVTAIAGEKLGQPVRLADLRLHLIPTPRVIASGIVVGKSGDARVGELEIVPDLLSFLTGPRTIRLIRASDVDLKQSALVLPPQSKDAEPGEPISVRRIELLNVRLDLPSVHLPVFDIYAELGEGLALERARLEAHDQALRLVVEPQAKGVARVSLDAKEWTLPAGAPLTFESLAAKGLFKGSRLELPTIDGVLYGGTLAGGATLDWKRLWSLSGKATLDGVDLVPIQQALGKEANLSGKLKATAEFSSQARSPAGLADTLALAGPFEVVGGAYQGVDLSKAGDLTGQPGLDDVTTFEELKGQLALKGRHVKIDALCVRSPKVVAGGRVEIDPEQRLSGKLDVSIAKTGGFVGVPVTLGGTTSDPSVRPSTSYIVGAAVGTAILPFIGTTLGASAASALEGKSSSCK